MRRASIIPAYVDTIPDRLDEGILYVCEQYHTVAHKCCCGCGEEVVTPLTPADWSLRKIGNVVSLTPSIGNWSFACKSHYWIRRNQVIWEGTLSQGQIDRVRARDRADKKAYIEVINRQKDQQAGPISWLTKLWQKIVRWWNS